MIQSPSGGVYIGSSARLERRRIRHFSEMRNNKHPNQALQRAWNKYGETLSFVVLEHCENEALLYREQWWIDYISQSATTIYNLRMTADCGGQPLSESTKRKLSESLKGRKLSEDHKKKLRKPKTAEHAAAISKGKKGANNIVWTDEERDKRRVALKRRWASKEGHVLSEKIKASWTVERRRRHTEAFAQRRILKHLEMLDWIAPAAVNG